MSKIKNLLIFEHKIVIVLSVAIIFLSSILIFLQIQDKNREAVVNKRIYSHLLSTTTPATNKIIKKVLLKTAEPVTTTLIFTGDIIPARTVNSVMTRRNDFTYPFSSTSAFLYNADFTISGMESPLIKNCPVTDKGMVFCGDQRFVKGLKLAGIDLVNLANNHILNYGTNGLKETQKLLSKNNIEVVGVNNTVYKSINGIKFAFVAYNDILPRDNRVSIVEKDKIKKDLQQAKLNSDFVVAMFHWGKEYSYKPLSDPPVALHEPKEIAHLAVESGADLVVGNHPHTVQGYEIYKDTPIFYALGNFIFDQMWSQQTRLGYVLKIELEDKKIDSYSFHPTRIDNFSLPVFLVGKEKKSVLEKIPNLTYN